MAWNQMTAEERRPYVEESLQLSEMFSKNKSMANKVNSIDQYQADKAKQLLFNTSLYNYSVAQCKKKLNIVDPNYNKTPLKQFIIMSKLENLWDRNQNSGFFNV